MRLRSILAATASALMCLSGANGGCAPAAALPTPTQEQPRPALPLIRDWHRQESARQNFLRLMEYVGNRSADQLREASNVAPTDGGFIEVDGYSFKMVGGAPIYVSNWAAVGGHKPVLTISRAQFEALPQWPRDGTFVTASDGRVYRFVAGAPFHVSRWSVFGGRQPAALIDSAAIERASRAFPWTLPGYTVDIDVNATNAQIGTPPRIYLNGSVFVRGAQTGRIYKMVGGAPLYVTTWAAFGGAHPATTVDQTAIDRAGQGAPWRFILKYPDDHWAVKGAQTGQAYLVTGGAPLYQANPYAFIRDTIGGEFRLVPAVIDQSVIDKASQAAPYDNLRYYPADGTYLEGLTWDSLGQVVAAHDYRVMNGAANPIPFGSFNGNLWQIDQLTIAHAGDAGAWSHLRAL